jgi:isopenicillin N synthase-like dioxygenase
VPFSEAFGYWTGSGEGATLPRMPAPTLPIIDFRPFNDGSLWRDHVGAQIDWACSEFGFFYLVGHGIDAALIERLLQLSRQFFAQDEAVKRHIHMSLSGRAWRGYFPVGEELTSGRPDLKEGIYFGSELPDDDGRVQAGIPLHGRNAFPDIPGFRETVLEYLDALTHLGQQLSRALARGLGVDETEFADHYASDPTILLRVFHYPPQQNAPADHWGVGEHTDYGFLTILKQDDVGGLQIKRGDEWLDVPPVPGSFVCNVGDMLEVLTGARYRSAPHRVRNVSNASRLSVPFFFDPSFDAKLAPISSERMLLTASPDRAHDAHTRANQVRGTYGEYLIGKVSKVFPQLGQRVLR